MSDFSTGVYCWKNRVNGRRYVGSAAIRLSKRMKDHIRTLIQGNHCNRYLQAAWNKYGSANFVFCILERCAPEKCIEREQYWIDLYHVADRKYGYNLSPTAGSSRGVKHSSDTRAKMSMARKTALACPEARAKKNAATKAGQDNPEFVAKRSMISKAVWNTPEYRAKISAARKAMWDNPKYRAKMTAKAAMATPESRAKMSAARKARWANPEYREKMKERAFNQLRVNGKFGSNL